VVSYAGTASRKLSRMVRPGLERGVDLPLAAVTWEHNAGNTREGATYQVEQLLSLSGPYERAARQRCVWVALGIESLSAAPQLPQP